MTVKSYNGLDNIRISPDEQWLAATDGRGLKLWPLKAVLQGEALPPVELAFRGDQSSRLNYLEFSPDSCWVAVGGFSNNTVALFEMSKLEASVPLILNVGATAYGLTFSPNSKQLATTDRSGKHLLWNLAQPKDRIAIAPVVLQAFSIVTENAAAFSPDGDWLISVADDRQIRAFTMPLDRLIDTGRGAAGRPLSKGERGFYQLDYNLHAKTENADD
jgi:WD40 repeat protein